MHLFYIYSPITTLSCPPEYSNAHQPRASTPTPSNRGNNPSNQTQICPIQPTCPTLPIKLKSSRLPSHCTPHSYTSSHLTSLGLSCSFAACLCGRSLLPPCRSRTQVKNTEMFLKFAMEIKENNEKPRLYKLLERRYEPWLFSQAQQTQQVLDTEC